MKGYKAELLTKPVPRKEVLKSSMFAYLSQHLQFVVPEYCQIWKDRLVENAASNSFLCRKIKVIGLAKERC